MRQPPKIRQVATGQLGAAPLRGWLVQPTGYEGDVTQSGFTVVEDPVTVFYLDADQGGQVVMEYNYWATKPVAAGITGPLSISLDNGTVIAPGIAVAGIDLPATMMWLTVEGGGARDVARASGSFNFTVATGDHICINTIVTDVGIAEWILTCTFHMLPGWK